MNNAWRIIETGSRDAAFNMALDEAIAIAVRQDLSPPTLRIYAWNLASVSIGYFQKSEDVATGFCRDHNIPFVRRPTGGRAVLHHNEVTYSFSVKTKTGLYSKGLLDSYKTISSAFQLALSKVGLPSESRKSKPASQYQNSKRKAPQPSLLSIDIIW